MKRLSKNVIIFGDNVGIITGTKMDPNYMVIKFILPNSIEGAVVHRERSTFTSLTASDVAAFKTFDEFKIAYPEYFV